METKNKDSVVDMRSVVEAISAVDTGDAPLYQVESLCMRCGENGITRFLLTSIPHFRKILLSAFECPHCNERNNEVQSGEIQPRGCHFQLHFPSGDRKMLNRQVVKSETATIKVEGILVRAADELGALQETRKKVNPQTAEAIDHFLLKLKAYANAESPFTLILDDPAGNSFIENPFAPSPDPSLTIKFYERTPEQQAILGYLVDPSQGGELGDEILSQEINTTADETRREPHGSIGSTASHRAIAQGNSAEVVEALFRYSAPEEVMTFPSTCGSCAAKCDTRMFVTNIPYFQEVIVMASTCDACGYRSSELKPGGRIPEKGKKIIVLVKNIKDLSRDVIKSDTASVKVPELDLELASGTLGGLVTTVEGLIMQISENRILYYMVDLQILREYRDLLLEIVSMIIRKTGGKTSVQGLTRYSQSFSVWASNLLSLEEPWTLILDDALANSFVAPATDDIQDDHQLTFEEYERSWEQNEELGLNDIDTSAADDAYTSTDAVL
ncbi:hypothetical protein RHGRI_011702 [Rhododendron griersonianum]|uniref:Zinc finger ZPR1-type domain-containing protein n=1 Tax=Rhododendron griersonianum TaxID=479676 RepID=A0AAV6KMU0_9ERIC|nr:hypothetical protein RHGRI_011702 [Rhododendron griersonianum]